MKDFTDYSALEHSESDKHLNDGSISGTMDPLDIKSELQTEEISIDVEPFIAEALTATSSSSMNNNATLLSPGDPTTFPENSSKRIKTSEDWENPELCYNQESSVVASVIQSFKDMNHIDDHEHFFKSLLPTIRKLDPVSSMEFRVEVQKLLLQYLKGTAENSSPVTQSS